MEFSKLLLARESVRNYDPSKPVAKETLLTILEAGRLSPSAANRQPWKFIIISSKDVLQKIHECYERGWFQNAPHVLIVVGNKNEAWVRSLDGYCSIETDLAIAMTHILLAAENEGVGACWISHFNLNLLRRVLNLQESEKVYSIMPLGYPQMGYQKKGIKDRKKLNDITIWL
jgi:nitroreductase